MGPAQEEEVEAVVECLNSGCEENILGWRETYLFLLKTQH